MIEFEMAVYKERLRLWKNNLPENTPLEDIISLEAIAKKFALIGASIVNIIQYACLKILASTENIIRHSFITEDIKKEYQKEGKTLNL